MAWHASFREKVIRTRFSNNYRSKYGRFVPDARLNFDQIPHPFIIVTSRTYHQKSSNGVKVWIAQPKIGLEKRQCTLQLRFSPGETYGPPLSSEGRVKFRSRKLTTNTKESMFTGNLMHG